MKKLLLVFFSSVLLFGCSSSDDDKNNVKAGSKFHPPTWIQGTWGEYFQENDPSSGFLGGIKFSQDDIIELTGEPNSPTISMSYKEIFKFHTVTEEYFSDKYVVTTSTTSYGTTITLKSYYFRTSNTTFKYGNKDNVNDAYTIYHKL